MSVDLRTVAVGHDRDDDGIRFVDKKDLAFFFGSWNASTDDKETTKNKSVATPNLYVLNSNSIVVTLLRNEIRGYK